MSNLGMFLIHTFALVAGLLAGFFIVFNSIFSDAGGAGERIFSFVLVILAYGILGLVFGFFANSWAVSLSLAAPAVLLVIWYSFREPGNLLLHLAYIVVTLSAAYLGAYAGARLRERRGHQSAAPHDPSQL